MDQPFYLKQLELGPMHNFIYLVGDPTKHEAAIVDPGWEIKRVLATAARDDFNITKAFITHTHFDHVGGLSDLLNARDIPIYVHRKEAAALKLKGGVLKSVAGGEKIQVGNVSVDLIHTPGHTPGSQCLLVNGHLLSGDTLFIGSCGRCDLPGGNAQTLYHSLNHTLKRLDDETLLCPGHNYAAVPTARLGDEKLRNPFLQPSTVHEFLRLVGMESD